jgi:hypothetical protein
MASHGVSPIALAGCLLLLGACAQSPESIQPAYVSSVPYESWNCQQLGEEQQHLTEALATASTQQTQARSNDTAGVILLGLPLASMSGENIAPQIAKLKGEQEAVHRATQHNACHA